MKYAPDYSSRFRILKGGKVSLVVSAMLMSASMVTSASAAVGDITITDTTFTDGSGNNIYDVTGTSPLNWSSNAVTFYNTTIDNGTGITFPMTSITVNGTNGRTINLGTQVNNQFNLEGSSTLLTLTNGTSATTINNYGTIATTSYTFNPVISITFGNSNTVINNYGTISAADNLDVNGNVVYTGKAIASLESTSQLNNHGAINGNISFSNGGTITNNQNATINGTINVFNNGGSLDNNGLVNLKPYVSNSVFYTSYIGTFTNNATGTLQINLDTDGSVSGTHYTNLETTNATFASGSTINVNVSNTSTNVTLLDGTTLNDVVSASNSLTINGTLNVTDNSSLIKFDYVEDGETIDLVVSKEQTLAQTSQIAGGSSNTTSAGGALDTATDNGQMGQFFTYLNQVSATSGDAGVTAAIAATTPASSVASLDNAMQTLNTVGTIVTQRTMSRNSGGNGSRGANSGDEMMGEKNLWVKPFFSTGKQDNKDGINGYDVKTRGIGMGADVEISAGNMAGLGLFYTKGDLDVYNMNQSSDMNAYTALVYGSTSVMEGKAEFLYQLGHTWQKTDSNRVDGTGSASADFTTKVAFLDLKFKRDYEIDKGLIVTPVVSATYRHIDMPSYTESGTSSALGSIEASTSTQLIAMGGATVQKYLDNSSKVIAEFNLGYDFHHKKESVTASYVGAPGVSYQYEGIDNGGVVYNAGLGYETAVANNQSVNFMYNLEGEGSSFQNHMFSLNYNIKF